MADELLRRLLEGEQTRQRGTFLPIETTTWGNVRPAVPAVVADPVQGIVNHLTGRYGMVSDPNFDQAGAVKGAFDAGTAIGGAGALATKPAGAIGSGAMRTQKPIRAYHGSPHDFDRFDVSQVGSGEGAQAYGHGLYFAEKPGVAQHYKEAVSQAQSPDSKLSDLFYLVKKETGGKVPKREQLAQILKASGDPSLSKAADDPMSMDTVMRIADTEIGGAELTQDHMNAMRRFQKDYPAPQGRMYEVDIQADPARFLDWDTPLADQPQPIQEGFARTMVGDDPLLQELVKGGSGANLMQTIGLMPKSKGSQAYKTLSERLSGDKAASEALEKAGIPGIRYLDQDSRLQGEGSRNMVVFNDAIVNIAKKYGIAMAAGLFGLDQVQQEQLQAQVGG